MDGKKETLAVEMADGVSVVIDTTNLPKSFIFKQSLSVANEQAFRSLADGSARVTRLLIVLEAPPQARKVK